MNDLIAQSLACKATSALIHLPDFFGVPRFGDGASFFLERFSQVDGKADVLSVDEGNVSAGVKFFAPV